MTWSWDNSNLQQNPLIKYSSDLTVHHNLMLIDNFINLNGATINECAIGFYMLGGSDASCGGDPNISSMVKYNNFAPGIVLDLQTRQIKVLNHRASSQNANTVHSFEACLKCTDTNGLSIYKNLVVKQQDGCAPPSCPNVDVALLQNCSNVNLDAGNQPTIQDIKLIYNPNLPADSPVEALNNLNVNLYKVNDQNCLLDTKFPIGSCILGELTDPNMPTEVTWINSQIYFNSPFNPTKLQFPNKSGGIIEKTYQLKCQNVQGADLGDSKQFKAAMYDCTSQPQILQTKPSNSVYGNYSIYKVPFREVVPPATEAWYQDDSNFLESHPPDSYINSYIKNTTPETCNVKILSKAEGGICDILEGFCDSQTTVLATKVKISLFAPEEYVINVQQQTPSFETFPVCLKCFEPLMYSMDVQHSILVKKESKNCAASINDQIDTQIPDFIIPFNSAATDLDRVNFKMINTGYRTFIGTTNQHCYDKLSLKLSTDCNAEPEPTYLDYAMMDEVNSVLKWKQNVRQGYSYTFCLVHETGSADTNSINQKTYQSFKVIQEQDPCFNDVTLAITTASAWTIPYSSSETKKEIVDLTTIFKQTNPQKCQMFCMIGPAGCTHAEPISHVSVQDKTLLADQNLQVGYNAKFCLACMTGGEGQVLGDFSITQEPSKNNSRYTLKQPTALQLSVQSMQGIVDLVSSITVFNNPSIAGTNTKFSIHSTTTEALSDQLSIVEGIVKLQTNTPIIIKFLFRVSSTDNLSIPYTLDQQIVAVVTNEPAIFAENLPSQIDIEAIKQPDGSLEDSSIFKFTSPFVTDRESMAIQFQLTGLEGTPSVITMYDKYFTLEVDRTKMSAKTAGNYILKVKFKDIASLIWDEQIINVSLKYTIKPAEPLADKIIKDNSTLIISTGESQSSSDQKEAPPIPLTQQEKELVNKGFQPTKEFGITFPGVKADKIKLEKDPVKLQMYKEPTLKIGPVSQQGQIKIDFSEPMIAPEQIDQAFYKNIFSIKMTSAIDGEEINGGYTANKRMLKASGEQGSNAFSYVVKEHTPEQILIQLEFDDPSGISSTPWGNDELQIKILELSVFKSALSGKPMNKDNLNGGDTASKTIPAQFNDIQAVESIQSATANSAAAANSVGSLNLVVSILLGGSMEHLWGMIRAVQIIVLSALIDMTLPSNVHLFIQGCMEFANVDLFSGEKLYELINYTETDPLTDNFEQFGIGDLNYLMNSGSYYVVQVGLILFFCSKAILSKLSAKCADTHTCRKIGVRVYQDNYWQYFKRASLKFFMESFFDICINCMLAVYAVKYFRQDIKLDSLVFGDKLNIALSSISYIGIVLFPLYMIYILSQGQQFLERQHSKQIYGYMYEGVNTSSKKKAFFNVIFLFRRLITAIILINFSNAFFQSHCLMLLSTINFIYLVKYKPKDTKSANLIEIMNELCVLICAHITNTLLDANMPGDFRFNLGYVFIGVAGGSILLNIIVTLIESIKEIFLTYRRTQRSKKAQKMLQQRLSNRKKIVELFPGKYKEFEGEIKFIEGMAFIKEWHKIRTWLLGNNVNLDKILEEQEYLDFLKQWQCKKKVMKDLEQRTIDEAASLKVNEIILKERMVDRRKFEVIKIKAKAKELSRQRKFKPNNNQSLNVIPEEDTQNSSLSFGENSIPELPPLFDELHIKVRRQLCHNLLIKQVSKGPDSKYINRTRSDVQALLDSKQDKEEVVEKIKLIEAKTKGSQLIEEAYQELLSTDFLKNDLKSCVEENALVLHQQQHRTAEQVFDDLNYVDIPSAICGGKPKNHMLEASVQFLFSVKAAFASIISANTKNYLVKQLRKLAVETHRREDYPLKKERVDGYKVLGLLNSGNMPGQIVFNLLKKLHQVSKNKGTSISEISEQVSVNVINEFTCHKNHLFSKKKSQLVLEIAFSGSLYWSLRNFFQTNQNNHKVMCKECGKEVKWEQSIKLENYPDQLILMNSSFESFSRLETNDFKSPINILHEQDYKLTATVLFDVKKKSFYCLRLWKDKWIQLNTVKAKILTPPELQSIILNATPHLLLLSQ